MKEYPFFIHRISIIVSVIDSIHVCNTNVDERAVFIGKLNLLGLFRSSKFLMGWSTIPIPHIIML